jgi:hypothetical protein
MNECDVFSVIFEWFLNNPQDDPQKFFAEHEWHIDLAKKTIDIEDRKDPPKKEEYGYYLYDIFTDYCDYKDWVNLARFIKGATHNVTVKGENVDEKVMPCIEWYNCLTYGGKVTIEKLYTFEQEFPSWHIAPEYIEKVEKIENGF